MNKKKIITAPPNSDNHFNEWINIEGGGMSNYIGVQGDIYALAGTTIWRYNRVWTLWVQLTGAGKATGVNPTNVYVISTDGMTIWQGNPVDDSWTLINTITIPALQAVSLISGGNQIYYTNYNLGTIQVWKYTGTPGSWTFISVPNMVQYLASGDNFAGLDSTGKVWTFISGTWTQIGTGFASLVGGMPGEFYGVTTSYVLYLWRGGSWNSTGSTWINGSNPRYVYDCTGLFGITSTINPGTYRCGQLQTWPQVTVQPNPSGTVLYNGSGSLALQPILADANGCYILLSC